MSDPTTAIFSVLDPRVDLDSGTIKFEVGRGTAVAISEDLLVTCRHVVTDAKEVTLFSHHPGFFEGENRARVEVIRTDENLDLALLRSSSRLPFLQLEDREALDDSMPLRIWAWPGWNTWWEKVREEGLQRIQDITSATLSPTPHAAVMTESWIENNILRFSFAGCIEGGMSGGPVVSALNNKVVGIITAGWNVDPEAVIDSSCLGSDSCFDEESQSWFERIGERLRTAAIAQLALGMGIAIGLKELKVFLDTKASNAL